MGSGNIDFTEILDPDFPLVDQTKVTPTIAQVATLTPTRTVDKTTGLEAGVFNSNTRPTDTQAEALITQAVQMVLSDMPMYIPEAFYPRVLQAVILKTAKMVESSYYREQYDQGSAKGFESDYEKLLASIEIVSGGASAGRRVDSIMVRSTMAEYEPDYPFPPPRVMPMLPFSVDGTPGDEGQQDN